MNNNTFSITKMPATISQNLLEYIKFVILDEFYKLHGLSYYFCEENNGRITSGKSIYNNGSKMGWYTEPRFYKYRGFREKYQEFIEEPNPVVLGLNIFKALKNGDFSSNKIIQDITTDFKNQENIYETIAPFPINIDIKFENGNANFYIVMQPAFLLSIDKLAKLIKTNIEKHLLSENEFDIIKPINNSFAKKILILPDISCTSNYLDHIDFGTSFYKLEIKKVSSHSGLEKLYYSILEYVGKKDFSLFIGWSLGAYFASRLSLDLKIKSIVIDPPTELRQSNLPNFGNSIGSNDLVGMIKKFSYPKDWKYSNIIFPSQNALLSFMSYNKLNSAYFTLFDGNEDHFSILKAASLRSFIYDSIR